MKIQIEQLENKVMGVIAGICPSCEQYTTFQYLGKQENVDGDLVNLYDCNKCESTRTLKSIMDFNRRYKMPR